MDRNKILIATLVFFGILFILTSFVSYKPNKKKSENISPNILYLTQPVTTFSGKVEKIEGNKITVSQELSTSTIKKIAITYDINITDKTSIYRPNSYINYLFKTSPPPIASKITIKDIKVGQVITAYSLMDLRTLAGDTFEATTISLSPIVNTLNGKIISLDGDVLTLSGLAHSNMPLPNPPNVIPTAPQEKEYQVFITPDTEISRMILSPLDPLQPPKNEKLSSLDLKKDMQVTVYTDQDVNESRDLKALRIEPNIQP